MGKSLIFTSLAVLAFAQETLSIPKWLESYPGAGPSVRFSESLAEASYTVPAQPAEIVEHYRKLLENQGLPFQPNPDGMGTSIRAEAHECDLLIQIRSREEGTFVAVNCSRNTGPWSPALPAVITGRPQSPASAAAPAQHLTNDEMMAQHHRIAAEMGLHRQHPDAPAPPLVWPSWLVEIRGGIPRATRGETNWKDAMLNAHYVTNVPMTELYHFYRDLLNSHEYPASSSMTTGHTQTGIQQNALGYVDGFNYPDGAPGAYTVIHVSFSRDVLNGPITVSMHFTTHEYIAKRGY